MFAWLAAAPRPEGGIDQLIAPLEALAVLRRDLDVRLHAAGGGSVEAVLEARRRLLRALQSVSQAELREGQGAVDEMRAHLTRLAAHLAELRALHDRMSRTPAV